MANRNERKYRFYRTLIYWILRLISVTTKLHVYREKNYNQKEAYIYAGWHQKIFLPVLSLTEVEKKATLISPSRDGEIMSKVLENCGYETVRGSSNDKKIRSLLLLVRLLKKGYSIGLSVDGPKGPIFQVKPGLVYLAQKTGVKIVPVGAAYSNYFEFKKAWDRFYLPKPFSTVVATLDNPIEIPESMSIESACELLKDRLNSATEKSEKVLQRNMTWKKR